MEKHINPNDKEYMRMAMLKHEETFKEQVYELHRLYQTQMILMKNIDKRKPKGHEMRYIQVDDQSQRKVLDLEQPADDYNINIEDSDGDNGVLEIINESQLELTLGPTSYNITRKSQKTLTSDSGPSSSSSTGSSQLNKTSTFPSQYQISDYTPSNLEISTSYAIKNSIEIEDGLKQPPWFFHALRLNMT